MNRSELIFLISFWISFVMAGSLDAQKPICGFTRDSLSGEMLVGSHIIEKGTNHAVVTDSRGYFSMTLKPPVTLQVSFIGYMTKEIFLNGKSDTLIQISLMPGTELGAVEVRAKNQNTLNSTSLSRKELLLTPSLGASPDVLKTIQLQPGINTQNEGSSILLVRGGNPGENLYLLDGVPLIHVNHLGGFLSVFNPEVINNLTIYKGGFPAKYGGKLSSIVDISQREGNNSGFKASVSVGITDASFAFEGPLKNRKFTYIVTGRKTFTEPIILLAARLSLDDYLAYYGFHDLNGKFSWRPDDRSSFHLNVYQGDDYLRFWLNEKQAQYTTKSLVGNTWGNLMLSARWNRIISPRIFMANTLSYTRYRLKYITQFYYSDYDNDFEDEIEYLSTVQDIALRSDWKYSPMKKLNFEYGCKISWLFHKPNERINTITDERINAEVMEGLETSLYVENSFKPYNPLEIRTGLRLVNYLTENYSKWSPEPRVNLNVYLSEHHRLNATYLSVSQHSHLIFTPQTFMNNEIWVPADRDIPSARSHQLTAGWDMSFSNGDYDMGVEVYYKKLTDLATYREGYTNLLLDANWKDKIETGGFGKAYGAEFLIRKNTGKLNGYIGYSISRATRQYPEINEGREYLFEYDRTHSGSVNLSYQIINKLTVSALWVYQTGLLYTPAIGRQYTQSMNYMDGVDPFYFEALIYGDRNSARMKDYHRLDLALVYHRITKKRKLNSTWTFSIYNAYNRQNPYYYYYYHNASNEIYPPNPSYPSQPVSLYQVSFFPVIPSISYKIYFGADNFKPSNEKISFKELLNKWLYYENY